MGSPCMQWMTTGILHFFISLFTNSANVLRKSDDAVPNERNVRIFSTTISVKARWSRSTFWPDGPDPPFVSIAAFKMRDWSISSYTIGWPGHVRPCNNTSWGGSLASGCFCFNIFKVLSFKGKIPFDMFSVKSLRAPLTLPLLIIVLNFRETIPFSLIFVLSWIVSPSCTKLLIFPSSHNFKGLSNDTKWSFDFAFLLDFWSNDVGLL